jgi:hypothetical protein
MEPKAFNFNVNLTPENVQEALQVFVRTLKTISNLIPGEKGNTLRTIAAALDNIMNSMWFNALVAYLVNTFGHSEQTPSETEVAAALNHFASVVKEGAPAPKAFLPKNEE